LDAPGEGILAGKTEVTNVFCLDVGRGVDPLDLDA
jgi:hypothetical protein